jgi:hypothetical protein
VCAFDVLALNAKDVRKWSLEARQGRLRLRGLWRVSIKVFQRD